jgi:hypothetical protein
MVGDICIVECKEKTSMEFLVLYSEVWQAWPQLDGKKMVEPKFGRVPDYQNSEGLVRLERS